MRNGTITPKCRYCGYRVEYFGQICAECQEEE